MTFLFPHKSIVTAVCVTLLLSVTLFGARTFAAESISCAKPVPDKNIISFFKRSAFSQLKLEFGDGSIDMTGLRSTTVGPSLTRVDGMAKIQKPGRDDTIDKRITGWVERCHGVVIIRGNTWLADGTLMAPRYSLEQLQGRGLVLGDRSAPIHLIAYVDSRCPHCHRLTGYAIQLVKEGKMYIEIRQTAFLESPREALQDTRLLETSIINGSEKSRILTSDDDYLEMLTGLSNEDEIPVSAPGYKKALALLKQNTKTARQVLGITNVPALLVVDNKKDGLYRLTGYWEMNRLLQPDL